MKSETQVNTPLAPGIGVLPSWGPTYPPLGSVNKPHLTTGELAYYLNRRPQTLRIWACKENGPIRAKRIGGRLAWSTEEAKALTGVAP